MLLQTLSRLVIQSFTASCEGEADIHSVRLHVIVFQELSSAESPSKWRTKFSRMITLLPKNKVDEIQATLIRLVWT